MKPALKVINTSTDARAHLAETIAARTTAEKAFTQADAALQAFDAELRATWGRRSALEDELANLRATERDLLIMHAGNQARVDEQHAHQGELPSHEALAGATAALAVAVENYDLGKQGRARIASARLCAEEDLDRARRKCDAAAVAVEATALPALLDAADEAQRRYFQLRSEVNYLAAKSIPHLNHQDQSRHCGTDIRVLNFLNGRGVDHQSGEATWQRAHAALLFDSSAALPTEV